MFRNRGFVCSCCGKRHKGLPFSYGAPAPAHWREELARDPNSELTGEQCVIEGRQFFMLGRIVIPVVDADGDFDWCVWVSLSEANFNRAHSLWSDPRRVDEPPYFGWLSTELPYQPTTLNLKTDLCTQPVGTRPTVELEPTDHPLAVEQRTGITLARVQAIGERLLHPDSPAVG
jgi:hypothetical protein